MIGAVGQPRDRNPAACYAILDDGARALTYVRVPYDIDTPPRKIRAAGLPRRARRPAIRRAMMATVAADAQAAPAPLKDVRHLAVGDKVDGFHLEAKLPAASRRRRAPSRSCARRAALIAAS